MDIRLNDDRKVLFQNGRLFLTESRQDSLRQRLQIRLRTQKGTWFLNITFGIDWLDDVLADGSTKLSVDTTLQAEILKESAVKRITYFSSSLDSASGIYTCEFSVLLIDNTESEVVRILANETGLAVVTKDGQAIRIK